MSEESEEPTKKRRANLDPNAVTAGTQRGRLDAMQADLDSLRQQVQLLRDEHSRPGAGWEESGARDTGYSGAMEKRLAKTLRDSHQTSVIGVWSAVLVRNEGGLATAARETIHTHDPGLPEAKILERIRPYTDPLALKALHRLIFLHLEGKPMALARAELAAILEVTAEDLDRSLLPLVAQDTVRRRVDAEGQLLYEVWQPAWFLLLLS